MKKHFLHIIGFLLITINCLAQENYTNTLNNKERLYILGKIYSEVKYNFINLDHLTYDYDSLYYEYIDKSLNAKNDFEYNKVLTQFVGMLNDGHTQVIIPKKLYGKEKRFYLVNFIDFKERLYINVYQKTEPLNNDRFLGAEVLNINGLSTKAFMEKKVFPYISASTKAHKWMIGSYDLRTNLYTDSLNLTVKTKKGIEKVLVFPQRPSKEIATLETIGKYHNHGKGNILDYHFTNDSILILELNTFGGQKISNQLNYIYDSIIPNSKGVVLDLRYNAGGDQGLARQVIGTFIKGDSLRTVGFETRVHNSIKKANGNWVEKYKPYFDMTAIEKTEPETVELSIKTKVNKPSVILIDRYTCSAAEDCLMEIYEVENRPLLIGTPTAGTTGSPLVIRNLPKNYFARICTKRQFYPYSKKLFINKGIQPDIVIHKSIEDYFNQKDPCLEKGIKEVRKQLN